MWTGEAGMRQAGHPERSGANGEQFGFRKMRRGCLFRARQTIPPGGTNYNDNDVIEPITQLSDRQ
jgi:hypothetical protein